MDVLLVRDGKVENCICADSVARAQQFYPDHLCIERTEALREWGPGDLYDGVNFSKAPRVVQPKASITKLEFLRRIPAAKRIAIRAAAKTDPLLEDALGLLDLAQDVNTDDQDTQMMISYCVQSGLLTPEEAQVILC